MLQIQNLYKAFPSKVVYSDANLIIHKGERVGLIGRNGIGKSTLFDIILDNINYEGNVNISNEIKIGYYSQDLSLDENLTVDETLFLPFAKLFEMEERMLELAYDFEKNAEEYERLYQEFESSGGYFITSNINSMISMFKLSNVLSQTVSTLSGGEKGRVMLAKILLSRPDILLLDEPLNHLDLEAIEWLEGFLNKFISTYIIISHDRFFLDNVCETIVEVRNKKIYKYKGNYSAYVKQSEHNYESLMNEYEKQQVEIDKYKKQIKQYRIWGESRSSEKMFKKAKELEKRLARIEVMDKPSNTDSDMRLKFNMKTKSGHNVIWLENVSIGYDDILVDNMTFDIYCNDKIALVGGNGTGKSTLLKVLANQMSIISGKLEYGSNVKCGYFDQIFETLDKQNSVIDELHADNVTLTTYDLRSHLAKFLFTNEDVSKSVSVLSGGECVRLSLAKLALKDCNVLLLDEPTNHLDLETREILEDALSNYEGTIIFSSHDRYFINKLSTKVFEISNNTLTVIDKRYEEYKVERDLSFDTIEVSNNSSKESYDIQKKVKGLEQKVKRIQDEVDKMHEEIKELELEKFNNEINSDVEKFQSLCDKIQNMNELIESKIIEICDIDDEIHLYNSKES